MPQIARNAEHDLCKLPVAFEMPLSIEVEVSVALRVPATARWCAVSGAVFRKCLVVRATRSFAVVVVLSTIDVTVLETVVFGSKMRLVPRHCRRSGVVNWCWTENRVEGSLMKQLLHTRCCTPSSSSSPCRSRSQATRKGPLRTRLWN
jgi:hypothetical protein